MRNSPIYYADRVTTPVMIIQGDMDFVPIQQGEEFFDAMLRQGKRAKFVAIGAKGTEWRQEGQTSSICGSGCTDGTTNF